jgi:hypothetical protein
LRLVFRGPLDAVDDKCLNRSLRGFQFQAELLLKSRKKVRLRVFRGSLRQLPAELRFVGSSFQFEIVFSGKTGLIDYRAVEYGAIHRGGKLRHLWRCGPACWGLREHSAGDENKSRCVRASGAGHELALG